MHMSIQLNSTNFRMYNKQLTPFQILEVSLDSKTQLTIEHAAKTLMKFPSDCILKLRTQGKIQDNLVEDRVSQKKLAAFILVSRQSIQFQATIADGEYISQKIPLKALARFENMGIHVRVPSDNQTN